MTKEIEYKFIYIFIFYYTNFNYNWSSYIFNKYNYFNFYYNQIFNNQKIMILQNIDIFYIVIILFIIFII